MRAHYATRNNKILALDMRATRDIFFPCRGETRICGRPSRYFPARPYRRKYPGQSVVCHVPVGRRGYCIVSENESATSSNTDGTLDETSCRAGCLFFRDSRRTSNPRAPVRTNSQKHLWIINNTEATVAILDKKIKRRRRRHRSAAFGADLSRLSYLETT